MAGWINANLTAWLRAIWMRKSCQLVPVHVWSPEFSHLKMAPTHFVLIREVNRLDQHCLHLANLIRLIVKCILEDQCGPVVQEELGKNARLAFAGAQLGTDIDASVLYIAPLPYDMNLT